MHTPAIAMLIVCCVSIQWAVCSFDAISVHLMAMQEMMELRLGSSSKKEAEDEPTKGSLAGGCCFDFNKVGSLTIAVAV